MEEELRAKFVGLVLIITLSPYYLLKQYLKQWRQIETFLNYYAWPLQENINGFYTHHLEMNLNEIFDISLQAITWNIL